MKKTTEEPKQLEWHLSLAVAEDRNKANSVPPAQWSPDGLDISEDASLEDVLALLRAFRAFQTAGTVALADIFTFARGRGFLEDVEKALELLEYDMPTVKKAMAVADVPRGLRHPKLTAEHYYVVSANTYEEQIRWLDVALAKGLSAFELKKSIEAGKPLTRDQIAAMSGQGSGISNYQGVLTQWDRWKAKVGGDDAILGWPRAVLSDWVDNMRPVRDLIDKAEARLAR